MKKIFLIPILFVAGLVAANAQNNAPVRQHIDSNSEVEVAEPVGTDPIVTETPKADPKVVEDKQTSPKKQQPAKKEDE